MLQVSKFTLKRMSDLSALAVNGNTEQFLRAVYNTLASAKTGPPPIETELTSLLDGQEDGFTQTKYIMACMAASKAVIRKPQCSRGLEVVIRSMKMFGNRVRYSEKVRTDYLSVALHLLLDFHSPIESMEELIRKADPAIVADIALYHPPGSPSAWVYNVPDDSPDMLLSSSKLRQKEVPGVGADDTFAPSSLSFRETSSSILKCLESFPTLTQIDVDSRLLSLYSTTIAKHQPGNALRLACVFPDKVTVPELHALIEAQLSREDQWDAIDKTIATIWDQRFGGGKPLSVNSVADNLLIAPSSSFNPMLDTVFDAALAARTTVSLRAGLNIATKVQNDARIASLRWENKKFKIQGFVEKDKWRLAWKMANNPESLKMLYSVLLEEKKYVEAEELLRSCSYLVPQMPRLDPALVAAHRQQIAETYLRFPGDKIKVHMVATKKNIEVLAHALGVPLTISHASSDHHSHDGHSDGQPRNVTLDQVVENSGGYRCAVGMDLEWPSDLYKSGERASIMQLAVNDQVFIVDLQMLSTYPPNGHGHHHIDEQLKLLNAVLYNMFASPQILKVSFSFDNCDQSVLQNLTGGFLKKVTSGACHFLDLQRERVSLERRLQMTALSLGSLSNYCQVFLGRPLNKDMRMSEWQQRPLSYDQISYAALDAHCLLAIVNTVMLRIGSPPSPLLAPAAAMYEPPV